MAKAKLQDYFAITKTSAKLRERLDLRRQEAGENIESFARDVKLIGHRAYPKAAEPVMLEHIIIKQFTNALNKELSRERVILKACKTFTEAAQYARFSESAVRVARTHSRAPSAPSIVSRLDFQSRGSSSGPYGFAPRGREQSSSRRGNFRRRGQGRSITRCSSSTGSRASSSGTGYGQHQSRRPVKCFNCQKIGHYACDCRNRSRVALYKDKKALETEGSTALKAVRTRTSNTEYQLSTPPPSKTSSKRRVS